MCCFLFSVEAGVPRKAASLTIGASGQKREGILSNDHYEQFYTTFFGIHRDFYLGKRILDVGCGPRGSLEWAPEDCEAFGVDPLVEKYLELGASKHRMRYVQAGAEKLPFPDSNFDAVFSFNNLDHVENVEEAVSEICRVLRPGGLCLLIVDINHAPKVCEPHTVKASIAESFGMLVEDRRFTLTKLRVATRHSKRKVAQRGRWHDVNVDGGQDIQALK
jgi:ubiquinone/menaquinone biosynthesis C-methylase UbiE